MKSTLKPTASLLGLTTLLMLFLSSCGPAITPSPTVDVNPIYTQAAATIVSGLTQTSEALPSATLPPPTSTPEPSATNSPNPEPQTPETPVPTSLPVLPSSTPVPIDPATARGCYNAAFVADVTIQFAPTFAPGDRFTKTWRVKNTGTCDWPRGFKIAFVSGDRFGSDTSTIDQKVSAGSMTEISLAMTAPKLTGVVTSNWQLSTDIGKPFGPVLSVAITLPAGTSTAHTSGCLNSALVVDVSMPTGTEIGTNTAFTKTWRIKNTGTCAWNRDFKITFAGGDTLSADTTKIRQIVNPGATTEISLDMASPDTTGTISSAWQMAADDGQLFGQLFAFSIVVK